MAAPHSPFDPPGPLYPGIPNSVYLGTVYLPYGFANPEHVGPPARVDLWFWRAGLQTVYCRWGKREGQWEHEIITEPAIQALPRVVERYACDGVPNPAGRVIWLAVALCRILGRFLAGDPDPAIRQSGEALSGLIHRQLGVAPEEQALWLMALEVQLQVKTFPCP